jgi:Domain of unknown function DUF83
MNEEKKAAEINLPTVTEIMGPYARMIYENVNLETLALACERGSKVHAVCRNLIEGYFVPSIDEDIAMYIKSFNAWKDESSFISLTTEKRYYDHEKGFSGQIDMVVKENGELVLYDIKTSSAKSKSWPIQLAAYVHLLELNGLKINKAGIIHLKKTGKKANIYLFDNEDLKEYWQIFLGMLNSYNYFIRKKVA